MRARATAQRALALVLLVSGAAAAEPGPAPAVPWCALVGSYGYPEFEAAHRLAEKLRAGGFAGAAVYDTRDFANLAWGQLALIAARRAEPDARKHALEDVRTLERSRLPAYAKPCQALAGARALEQASQIRPPATLPTEPAQPSVEAGCFGWSPRQAAAACVTGRYSMQEGCEWKVELVGGGGEPVALHQTREQHHDHPTAVPPSLQAELVRRLSDGSFVCLPEGRRLEPGGAVRWASPRVAVTWQRRRLRRDGDGATGRWWVFSDVLTVECGARRTELMSIETSSDQPSGSVHLIPGGRYVVVDSDVSFAEEGDQGREAQAWVVDIATCVAQESGE